MKNTDRKTIVKVSALALAVLAAVGLAVISASPKRMPARPGAKSKKSSRARRPKKTGPASKPCIPGSRRLYRLADHVHRAKRSHPDLKAAYRKLGTFWRRNVDPFSGLGGSVALMRQVVGFARPDIAGFAKGQRPEKTPYDPGPGRGVADARLSLFMPVESTLAFPLTLSTVPRPAQANKPPRYVFTAELGVVRAGPWGPVTFAVTAAVTGKPPVKLIEHTIKYDQRNLWFPVEVDLSRFAGKAVQLILHTRGPAMAGALVARPEIWAHDSCRKGPNILMVVVDTLRADAVGAVSGRHGVTVNLDQLSAKGTNFTRCFAAATWTRPALTALFASEYPSRLGLPRVGFKLKPEVRQEIYRRLFRNLATVHLNRLGYRTAAIGNNFFFLGHSSIGLDRGFDQVIDIRHPRRDTPAIAEAVKRFLTRNRSRPFFLWVHFDGPHWPYQPPAELNVRGARAPGAPRDRQFESYLGEARYADRYIGHILDALKSLNLKDTTLVVATADHGEIFSDAHTYDMSGHITRHRHGWSIYDEVLHVPLIIAGPSVPVRKISNPVSHLDVMPTLLSLAGLPSLPRARGASLVPMMRPKTPTLENRPIVSEGRRQESIRYKGLKFIRRSGFAASFTFRGARRHVTRELYDVKADPAETRNLAKERPEDADRLNAHLDRLLKSKAQMSEGVSAGPAPGGADQPTLCVRLWGGKKKDQTHRLKIRITARGRLAVTSLTGRNVTARWPAKHAARLELELTARSGAFAQASVRLPPGAVKLALDLDGKKVDPKKVWTGPFGLSLLESYTVLNAGQLDLLASHRPPALPDTVNAACAMWTHTGEGALIAEPAAAPEAGTTAPEKQVDDLLRGWGYVKGKKKR